MNDEDREKFMTAMHLMRDAFTGACALIDWDTQGELQGRFFDGYAEVKRLHGALLLWKEVFGPSPD